MVLNAKQVFLIIIVIVGSFTHVSVVKVKNVCKTPVCQKVAAELKKSIDTSVDPCNDIYGFVCNGWKKMNPADGKSGSNDQMSDLHDKVKSQLRDILEEPTKENDTQSIQYVRRIYNMCMDKDKRETIGLTSLNKIITSVGGWPMIMSPTQWNSKISWQEISQKYNLHYVTSGLYRIGVFTDSRNSSKNIIHLMEPEFLLPREILVDPLSNQEQLLSYTEYIRKVAAALAKAQQYEPNPQQFEEDAMRIVQLEIEIAGLTTTNEDRRDVSRMNNWYTIKEFQDFYDVENPENTTAKINWLSIIKNQLSTSGIDIDSSENIIVWGLNYFRYLSKILDKTPLQTIVNYVHWQSVRHLVDYTNNEMRLIKFGFRRKMFRISEEPQRQKLYNIEEWKECVSTATLDHALSYEYIKRHFSKTAKQEVLRILMELKKAVKTQIRCSVWMDSKTKKAAREKINLMIWAIGYPEWYSNEAIDQYHKNINITSTFLETATNVRKFLWNRQFKQLREAVDRKQFSLKPTEVDGGYDWSLNTLIMTAGMLQSPLYVEGRPESMNYGILGFAFGHEISHAFDDIGSKFDGNGNFHVWWSKKTLKTYNKKVQCFINQYNNYTVPELATVGKTVYVNGRLTLGENIGDSTGITLAWKAWKAHKKRIGSWLKNMRLPGLENYTSNQLFFMGIAYASCQNLNPSVAEHAIMSDEHAPWQTRITGSFSNSFAFNKVFRCRRKTPMNPLKKCMLL